MSDQNDDLSRVFPESITALVPQTDAYSGLIVHNGERSMHLRDYWRVIQNHRKAVPWTVRAWLRRISTWQRLGLKLIQKLRQCSFRRTSLVLIP
jgi:hypothetical protein